MLEEIKKHILSADHITDAVMRPFQRFFEKEVSSSILLLAATVVALFWANSPFSDSYHELWHLELSLSMGGITIKKDLLEWVNDGLMAFFFFVVGLEIKREVLVGELASVRKAFLPAAAALGGMIFPAVIHFALNHGQATARGWGIPMATDIAFSLAAVAVLGKKLPAGLRVFLSAFAIADDLGAVLVIAIFYTKGIALNHMLTSLIFVLGLAAANILWIRNTLVYSVLGIGLWLTVLGSGLHATVAGVVVAIFIPARGKYDTDRFISDVSSLLNEFQCEPSGCGDSILLNARHLNAVQAIELSAHHAETPLQRLGHSLHPWVAYAIVPLFALANAGVDVRGIDMIHTVVSPNTLGISLGLLLGKPLGITLFSYAAVRMKMASLPRGMRWSHLLGAGMLGGIGFTMSLFISAIGFDDPLLVDQSKIGILAGSILSATAGLAFLSFLASKKK
jgi:NhaA family Na+:H+ antiporter